ncbi:cell division protein DedD [Vibrio parahaemolyticus]|uniref:SPOR domain-containing protein n=1 Tax=Vibrio parahaemolyticus TaxID=670 RepID=UPI000812FEF4|nr:SPOR domain-containing protein [Vibrio parahaemolyticus]EGQ8082878.1 SPOR domain-containing protein [Vibrio parahaemolyticus]EGR0747827.1 SPOR domain-containing protein [Vibrio parahaemolyticus]EGR1179979.1 SPOR domain-containing protein [Vibrio parahaemolyticus]EHO8535985.1 SPOR domain-containing protein [Vibrio parahaemolyticus]EIF2843384.1 SPOR domain-containing protein [Vibrio parahaemolyticus]
MASKFQSRLVGTIILVAVGVIVLPDVLDGKKLHYKEEFASIPIKPELDSDVENFEILEPVEDDIALPESPVEAVVQESEERQVNASQPEQVEIAVRPVEEKNQYEDSAWIIQLMALKNHENAEALVADLQKRGYQAHTKKENDFTRVIVGPDVSKSKLERQVQELQKITGSKGQLLKFKPLNP